GACSHTRHQSGSAPHDFACNLRPFVCRPPPPAKPSRPHSNPTKPSPRHRPLQSHHLSLQLRPSLRHWHLAPTCPQHLPPIRRPNRPPRHPSLANGYPYKHLKTNNHPSLVACRLSLSIPVLVLHCDHWPLRSLLANHPPRHPNNPHPPG